MWHKLGDKSTLEAGVRLFEMVDRAVTPGDFARVGSELERQMPMLGELGFNLWLWLGLKEDGEREMASDFRKLLMQEFSAYEPRQKRPINGALPPRQND